jgi:hypothetical protein
MTSLDDHHCRPADSALQHVARIAHKWAGLFAAAWLLVLGATGFFLNNPEWRWLQQTTAPSWATTPRLAQTAALNVARLWQIDPDNSALRIAAGPRGMWSTTDGGADWRQTRFGEAGSPQILAVEPDPGVGWKRLWIGTDEGVYVSIDRGETAQLVALRGARVTSLAAGSAPGEILGVIDKSTLFRLTTADPSSVQPIEIAPLEVAARPTEMPLQKYIRSVHFGRGLFDPATSHLVNEAGGLALALLAITGLVYWALPRSWNARARVGKKSPSSEEKRLTLAWLYRIHGATVGLVFSPVILYLALTGSVVGHDRELGEWLRSIRVASDYFTPAFKLSSWGGSIDSVVGYPGVPGSFSVGNHLGMFTTIDDGRSWALEEAAPGQAVAGATRMRRLGDIVVVMAGMSGAAMIRSDDGRTIEANIGEGASPGMARGHGPSARGHGAKGRGMSLRAAPQDVTRIADRLYWKAGGRWVVTDMAGNTLDAFDAEPPRQSGAPLAMWLRQLHAGVLLWSDWRWINDVFAACAIILTVSGIIRWRRRKWA